MTKLITLGILFPTAVRAKVVAKLVKLVIFPLTSFIFSLRKALVAKLVILGVSPLTSFILAFRVVLVIELVISGISSLIFLILALYKSFLTASFLLHHLVYLNQ